MNVLKQNAKNIPTDHIKSNSANNQNNKTQTKLSAQTMQPLMTTKGTVESTWAEDMWQFLYHLDPDTGKITKLEKLKLKIINIMFHHL